MRRAKSAGRAVRSGGLGGRRGLRGWAVLCVPEALWRENGRAVVWLPSAGLL